MKVAYCGPISLSQLSDNINITNIPNDGYAFPLGSFLVNSLLKMGIDVLVVTSVSGIDDELTWETAGLKVIATPRRKSRKIMIDCYAKERKAMVAALRRNKPDIVHAQWTYEFCHAARTSGFPYLVTAHDAPWTIFRYFRKFYRFYRALYSYWALRGVRNLTAVSPHIASNFKRYHAYTDDISIIPNAIPDNMLVNTAKKHPGNGILQLISVTSWSSLKNVKTTLRAFSLLLEKYPSARLRLIGRGLNRNSEGHIWADKRELSRNVEFCGEVPHAQIMRYLRNDAHLFVYSSLEESFCMAVLESMASGVPVVILPDTGAIPWLVGNGVSGEIAVSQRPEALTKACSKVLDSPDHYEQLARAGLNRVAENFMMNQTLKLYTEAYKRVLCQ